VGGGERSLSGLPSGVSKYLFLRRQSPRWQQPRPRRPRPGAMMERLWCLMDPHVDWQPITSAQARFGVPTTAADSPLSRTERWSRLASNSWGPLDFNSLLCQMNRLLSLQRRVKRGVGALPACPRHQVPCTGPELSYSRAAGCMEKFDASRKPPLLTAIGWWGQRRCIRIITSPWGSR